ncbi:MAG: HAD family phosphatase [Deltaproteobacteria bacterium]|nr:HAD family phosphatase [Deltaproteobacteria bacterium]MCB9478609.1 HAD family phosphatase [Deltaproteobacteria bacterium]MCB9490103.1 HAD family phosphatase [Deltaproteobacteria bacterium]
MRYKALLLDLDGTLADSLPVMYESYQTFLAHHRACGTIAEFTELNGPALPEVVATLRFRYGLRGDTSNLISEYAGIILERYATHVEPNVGARELLEAARKARVPVALVTSAVGKHALAFLRHHHLRDYFDCMVTGEDVARSKPDPAIYKLALKRLQIEPKDALTVEDSRNGLLAALAAGMRPVAYGARANDLEPDPEGVLMRISHLADVVGLIEGRLDAA